MDLKIKATYSLSAVDVIHYENGMVELIGKKGLSVSAQQVQEMFDFMDSLSPRPVVALTNRKNQYSFSFAALQTIQKYRGVKALAILVYSRTSYIAAQFARSKNFQIKVFMDRDHALEWLNTFISD